jgi:hypothetical protein
MPINTLIASEKNVISQRYKNPDEVPIKPAISFSEITLEFFLASF